ncbi:hypothetical protein H2200_012884 [Cladophialophora chaetospira]|uniref:Protein kinase domain-containing protein n=1 Tax=Cladophialophora chaetospira TaxID=386627 RepID=A0AA39CC06_9EURO|nr:hypothetical protein H2200_012884 [Cladophialophora chaetospira]
MVPSSRLNPLPKPAQAPTLSPADVERTFRDRLQHFTVTPVCGECRDCGRRRRYIQVEKLRNWLKEKCPQKPDTTWADQCLEAANQGYNAGSLSLGDINARGRECLLVFSILYDIGEPSLIQYFQMRNLTDTKLPISLLELETELKGSSPNAAQLAQKFDKRQWAFCPTSFDWSSRFNCKKQEILPICRRAVLSRRGGTALVWQIAVQEEFVGPKLRTLSAKSKFYDEKFGICYQFALKTFRDGHAKFFEEECEAFWALREHNGMIRYLGDFSHPSDPSCQAMQENAEGESVTMAVPSLGPGEQHGRMTTNILLEWGETDLEDFFAKQQPPVLRSEVRIFWKELFGVAEALRRVHNFKKKNGHEFDGWHADIKPDNILRVQSSFKLSDPGFAKFVPQKQNNTTKISGGTSTYGAPEWERSRKTGEPVPQSIDIWSLGCVFSIAATWVALGYNGILGYERLRENAIKTLLSQQDFSDWPEADFFHDGSNVLEAIPHWHDAVRQNIRRTDTLTVQVLDLVTGSMLQGNPKQRITATALCARLNAILDSCPESPEFAELPDVQTALNEVQSQNEELHAQDVPEPRTQQSGPFQDRATRDAQKTYNMHMARMRSVNFGAPTAGSSLRPSISREIPKPRFSQDRPSANHTVDQGGTFYSNKSSTSQSGVRRQDSATRQPRPPPNPQFKRTSTMAPPNPQDVFQARHELEELAAEQKRGLSNKFKMMVTPDRTKNKFLAEFFDNRDIIFVADNAGSMAEHWPQATELLDVLVKKAKNLDENGMDLYFTHTNGKPNAVFDRQGEGKVRISTFPKVDGKKDVAKFKEAMKVPDSKPVPAAKTDMSLMLGFLLDMYIKQLKDVGTNKAKKQTIIILTDGKWELDKVSEVIKDFVNDWKGLDRDKIKSRSMGIQFVQFGNDPDATLRLDYLDNKLEFEGIPDIVDTEPSLGDVYKMLIGSFDEAYDKRSSVSAGALPSPAMLTSTPAIILEEHDMQRSPPSLQVSNELHQTSTNGSTKLQLPSGLERLPSSLDPGIVR